MEMIFELSGETLIAALLGEMDHHCAEKVRTDIDENMALYESRNLLLDFSRVTFMDSAGIGVVLGRYKRIESWGGKVMLCGCNGPVKRILAMAGVFTLIEDAETREEAMVSLQRKEVS